MDKEIEIDLTDDEFLRIAKMAHERNITFNEMVVYILQEHINFLKENNSGKNNS